MSRVRHARHESADGRMNAMSGGRPAMADASLRAAPSVTLPARGPFALDDDAAYRAWRARKLERTPGMADELIVAIGDPRMLSSAECDRLLDRCARANMAIYASRALDEDKGIVRRLASRLGLARLDAHWLADDDGISRVTVAADGARGGFIPYTDRPIRWHTDGYYNPPERAIRGMLLHCVRPAARGGENRLLDHEIAYLRLRDENPRFIVALSAADAMTIPARADDDGVARPAQSGPVFSIDSVTGALQMRYTARTRSIEWRDDPLTREAVACLVQVLADDPRIVRVRLEAGMGVVCNNVLHDRAAFEDAPGSSRLLYRARYFDRIRNTARSDS